MQKAIPAMNGIQMQMHVPLCPYFVGSELAPATANLGDEKNVLSAASMSDACFWPRVMGIVWVVRTLMMWRWWGFSWYLQAVNGCLPPSRHQGNGLRIHLIASSETLTLFSGIFRTCIVHCSLKCFSVRGTQLAAEMSFHFRDPWCLWPSEPNAGILNAEDFVALPRGFLLSFHLVAHKVSIY